MAQRLALTVTEAVEAFAVERRALQRLLAGGKLDGAFKDNRGRWRIPIESLHAAQLPVNKTWISSATERDNDATNSATERDSDATERDKTQTETHEINVLSVAHGATNSATGRDNDAGDLRAHIALLQVQLDAEKEKNEQLRDNLSDMRRAMLMLETRQTSPASAEPAPMPPPAVQGKPRRRWWNR